MTIDLSTAIVGALCTVGAAVVSILLAAFRIGRAYGAIERATLKFDAMLTRLERLEVKFEKVDVHDGWIRQLQEVVREISTRIARIEGGNEVRSRMDSRPNFDGE